MHHILKCAKSQHKKMSKKYVGKAQTYCLPVHLKLCNANKAITPNLYLSKQKLAHWLLLSCGMFMPFSFFYTFVFSSSQTYMRQIDRLTNEQATGKTQI